MSAKRDITHLTSFSYAPAVVDSISRRGHSANHNSRSTRRSLSISHAEFVSANFKFIVHSDGGFDGGANPDSILPWNSSLLAVVVSVCSRDLDESKCPICLSQTPVLPVMSKCGHMFCACCIIRHFGEHDCCRKCPVCNDFTHIIDLRRVRFQVCTTDVTESNKHFTFKLVTMHGLFPSGPDGTCTTPSYDDIERAPFSRIAAASTEQSLCMLAAEEQEITAFRADCLAAADGRVARSEEDADVELLPFLDIYQNLLSKRREALQHTAPQRAAAAAVVAKGGSSKVVALYQDPSGSLVFLHPLCLSCLLASVEGEVDSLPAEITARVIESEEMRVTQRDRDRNPMLRHIPLHANVRLVEVNMSTIVSKEAYSPFAEEFGKRKLRRQERARRLKSETKRYARQQSSEKSLIYAMKESFISEREREVEALADLLGGPALSSSDKQSPSTVATAVTAGPHPPLSFAKAATRQIGFEWDFPELLGSGVGTELLSGEGVTAPLRAERTAAGTTSKATKGKKTVWKKVSLTWG